MIYMDGQEVAKAIQEYLKNRGHKPTSIKLYSEEEKSNEGQPQFWAVVETKPKGRTT